MKSVESGRYRLLQFRLEIELARTSTSPKQRHEAGLWAQLLSIGCASPRRGGRATNMPCSCRVAPESTFTVIDSAVGRARRRAVGTGSRRLPRGVEPVAQTLRQTRRPSRRSCESLLGERGGDWRDAGVDRELFTVEVHQAQRFDLISPALAGGGAAGAVCSTSVA